MSLGPIRRAVCLIVAVCVLAPAPSALAQAEADSEVLGEAGNERDTPGSTVDRDSAFDGCAGIATSARGTVNSADARLLPEAEEPLRASSSAPLLRVDARGTGRATEFAGRFDSDKTQIVGESRGPVRAVHLVATFTHQIECGVAAGAELSLELLPLGQVLIRLSASEHDEAFVLVDVPWAVDSTGRELRSWFRVDGSSLLQYVDATGSSGAIVFDPTYSQLLCGSFQNDRNASQYINMSQDDSNPSCPGRGIFIASRGYMPQWGYEQYVFPSHGKVAVDPLGDKCSNSPDGVVGVYNFTVPCLAHDYCYDLRRAGFSGTVSKGGCDDRFFDLMRSYCDNRHSFLSPLRAICRSAATTYWNGVDVGGSTSFEPGLVMLRNRLSSLCVGVDGSLVAGASVQQESCFWGPDRRWRVQPVSGSPGRFELRPNGMSLCARIVGQPGPPRLLDLANCVTTTRVLDIQGHDGLDRYSLRSNHFPGECLSVPNTNSGARVRSVACASQSRQRWDILPG